MKCPPFSEQPILSEVARFDWTLSEVFDAADAAPLERKALNAVDPNDWAELMFRFHPSLRRLLLAWNSVPVWQALSADEQPPDPERAPQPVPWLLWRRNLKNYFRSMDEIESAASAGRSRARVSPRFASFWPSGWRRGDPAQGRDLDRYLGGQRAHRRDRIEPKVCRFHLASPRKTVNARFNRTTSSSFSLPMRLPSRAFGTVVTLSIITREALLSPLRSVGSIGMRNNGASVGSVVNAHKVMESVCSKRSSCTMTAGRGFPA